jgi:hypothetical protein
MLLQSVRAVKMVKTHIGMQAALPWFRTLTAETRVVVCVKVCSGQFSPDTSGLPCQYYSTNAPYPSSFSLNTTFVRRTSGLR